MMKLLTTTAVCLALAACASTGPTQKTATESTSHQVSTPPAQPKPVAETEAQKMSRLLTTLSKESVYFDFDKYNVKPQYENVIQQNADFMKEFGKDTVVLEGNTDERGSKEYNLALGQKRAESVGQALKLMGIPDSRIEAVSFGEEKPRATCNEEKCWKENRRVDFDHKSK
ncbi:outer membrane lipoprotein Omp16 precursor [mine drainage metagenome]|uniref:Outer membrane lipoprotein Omp16 n=1 Tax=mine drainage metagenome TaxID=410659 RepID=A0A1J5RCC5_9ZZZZ